MTARTAVDALLDDCEWLAIAKVTMPERGRYYKEHQVVLLRHGLTRAEWNCTAMHEALHAVRGDERCASPELEARQEQRVDQDAAWLLIDIRDLADAAAAHPDDPHRIADDLEVDMDTLVTRLEHLHPAERHYLRRRLEHVEGVA